MNKILIIYNNAPLYREGIFTLMDKEFYCDWIFGEPLGDIKQLDFSKLRGKTKVVRNVPIWGGKAYWQKNVIEQLFGDYTHYIFLGEERCLSTWIFLFLAKFRPSRKIYFWSHGPYGKEGFLKKTIQKIFYGLVDGTFLYGNYAKELMIKRGFDVDKLFTIHNSLNYERQLELRDSGLASVIYRDYFGNDNKVLIFIGRLTKVKQLDKLVDALSVLKIKGETYNLVFVGDGEESRGLKEKVGSLALENQVWFYGACYDEKTNAELIYNADLCVAPGNVGLTAMHTMVFGTPVITHNNFPWQMPEFEAIKPGVTGCFFDYEDTESLAASISEWFMTNSGKRDHIRKSCYSVVDNEWNPYFQMNVLKQVLL